MVRAVFRAVAPHGGTTLADGRLGFILLANQVSLGDMGTVKELLDRLGLQREKP